MAQTELSHLFENIVTTHQFFQKQAQQQVNVSLTLRNWCIGYYLFEYEQQGENRAVYGDKLYKHIAKQLKDQKIKGMSFTNLHLFKQFYLSYPAIVQTLSEQFNFSLLPKAKEIEQTSQHQASHVQATHQIPPTTLIQKLSFSHFIELLKLDNSTQRSFYEIQSIKNVWSVRELQRAINSLLYERTGLSQHKDAVLQKYATGGGLSPQDVFRNPYMLDFLGLEEKSEYSESDLEQAIIDHLQHFLLELGQGFCFEARQKRITFDNTHYKIDLVFYHRILKCHVLVDLKIGEFSHADAGQMNVYLNYFADQEMQEGDNPPIGIILCAGHHQQLVKYATAGLAQQIFVSKYLINLPSEDALKQIIHAEQLKYHEP